MLFSAPRHRPTALSALLAAGFLASGGLQAQTTASVRITLKDAQGRPVAGERVTLASLERAEQRQALTNGQGEATLAGLLPGNYRILGQTLHLRADERAQVTLRPSQSQAVVVVESSPLRTETASVSVQTSFSQEDLARLPSAPHRFVEYANLAPGVTPSGKPEPVVLGSMLDGNAFLVDGMATNLSSNGRFGMNLSTEILESQTLTTGGHKAEIGFAPGGVFSMVTKSGGNSFQGSLFGSRIARGVNSRPDPGKPNTPDERATDAKEFGFSLSGPIVRDRLFFYAAFNRQLQTLDFENVQPLGTTPHRRSQEEDRSYRFAKLTWIASPLHRLEFSYFGDPVTQTHFDSAGDAKIKDFQLPDRTRGGDSYLLKHVGILGAGLTWENTLGLHRTSFNWSPSSPEAGPFRDQLGAPADTFGAYREDRLDRIRNLTFRSEVSLFPGGHQLKAGFQGLWSEYTQAFKRPSGGELYLDRASGTPNASDLTAIRLGLTALHGTDFGYSAADSLATLSPVSGQLQSGVSHLYQRTLSDLGSYGAPLKQRVMGLFLQDDWRCHPALTANLGLRLDRASVAGEDGRQLYAQTLLSPRLGLSWDPAANGSMRVFGYYGRIYSPPTPGNLTAAGAITGGPALTQQAWIPGIAQWKSYQVKGVQGVQNVAIGDLQAPRTDLVQLGVERTQALGPLGTWILEAVYTRKAVRDLVDTYDPAYGYLTAADLGVPALVSGTKVIANLPGLKQDYRGFDLSLHRRFQGGHLLQFSYSHGQLDGNSEVGNVTTVTGKSTGFAAIPSLRQDYRAANAYGPLNESLNRHFKAFGTAQLPLGFEAAGAFSYRSGLHYSPLVLAGKDNVLAPGARRGSQQLPNVASLDLSLAYTFKLDRLSCRAALDVLNFTNQQPLTVINNVAAATPGNYQQPRVYQVSFRAAF